MTKQGRIVANVQSGIGKVVVEGTEHRFSVTEVWRSPIHPASGMDVDVFMHPQYGLVAMQPSQTRPQPLAIQPAGIVIPMPLPAKLVAPLPPAPLPPMQTFPSIQSKTEWPLLAAVFCLLAGWFLLPSVQLGFAGFGVGVNFWNILGHVGQIGELTTLSGNSGSLGGLLFLLLGVLALAGPFLQYIWKDKRAALAGILPLAVMILTGLCFLNSLRSAASTSAALFGADAARFVVQSTLSLIHPQFGLFLSLAAAIYLAAISVQRYVATRY